MCVFIISVMGTLCDSVNFTPTTAFSSSVIVRAPYGDYGAVGSSPAGRLMVVFYVYKISFYHHLKRNTLLVT